jgi:hypothetical protein
LTAWMANDSLVVMNVRLHHGHHHHHAQSVLAVVSGMTK